MKNIISASRRTDIPAFYSEWFLQRLSEGFLFTKNPYSGKIIKVSLKPEHINSIVFWSKNFTPLIPKLDSVERVTRNLFFHFTITGINGELEPRTPDKREAARDLARLSERYGPDRVIWRFDPIVVTDVLTLERYEEAFVRSAEMLRGKVRDCYISFVHPYRKVLDNFRRHSPQRLAEPSKREKRAFARRLARIAEGYGLRISACCNDFLLSPGVSKGSCINGERLGRLSGAPSTASSPSPTRKGCGCTRSIDVGTYDTCAHGCLYCYANADRERAKMAHRRHVMEWNGLGFNVDPAWEPGTRETL